MTILVSLKRNMLSTKYLLIFLVLTILVCYSLSQELLENLGLSEFFIRTASEVSFLQNIATRQYMIVLTLAGPLLTTVACSSIYVDDWEANMVGIILVRTSRLRYQISNIISVFISSFILIFGPLTLGYLIALIACPLNVGMDNMTATPTYSIETFNTGILGVWESSNPIVLTLFYICLVAVILSLLACLSYVITQFFYWNCYIAISVVFVAYLTYNIVLSRLAMEKYTFFNLIDPYATKPELVIIAIIIFVLVVIIILLFAIGLWRGSNND